jgi:type VI secretion system secreted protein Hcp
MNEDVFLKITGTTQGEMQGESQKAGKENQTQISGFSIGAFAQGSYGEHGGGSVGKAQFSDISYTAEFNAQSPKIFNAMRNQEVLTECILTARKGTGAEQGDYLTVTLTNAVFTGYNVNVGGGGASISGSINWDKISIDYKPQAPDGSLGSSVLAEFTQTAGK